MRLWLACATVLCAAPALAQGWRPCTPDTPVCSEYIVTQCGPGQICPTRPMVPIPRTRVITRPPVARRASPAASLPPTSSAGRDIVGLPPVQNRTTPQSQQPQPSTSVGRPRTSSGPSTSGLKPACQCPQLKARFDRLEAAIAEIQCEPADLTALEQKLDQILTAISLGQGSPAVDIAEILSRLDEVSNKLDAVAGTIDLAPLEQQLGEIQSGLTAVGTAVNNAGETQDQMASAILETAQAQQRVSAKLDQAIALLQAIPDNFNVTLTVQSTPNLPASYVDTSTIWAVQRKTGISHAVLVINSADPDWERLEPEYVRARHKFPAMQLVDVEAEQLKISPTPQLVLYYADEGREPEIISGDRAVGAKLREFYSK